MIKPEILKDDRMLKAFDGDFGEAFFDHEPTAEDIFLIKLKLVAQEARDDCYKEMLRQFEQEKEKIRAIIKEYKLNKVSARDDIMEKQAIGWPALQSQLEEEK